MNMPGQFSVDSVSAGNMFLGAFLPGVVLVSLYMLYVLLIGIFKKEAVINYLQENKNDVVLTLGAGDISDLVKPIINILS